MYQHSEIDLYWMKEALALAHQAAAIGEVPVGAILVDANNQAIGRGYNQPIGLHDPSAHAEIMALRDGAKQQGNYRLPNTTLYVTIEPCAMCAGTMVHARIKRLVYAAPEPKAGVVNSNLNLLSQSHNNHQIEVTAGVLEEEAGKMMSEFFANRRAQKKLNS